MIFLNSDIGEGPVCEPIPIKPYCVLEWEGWVCELSQLNPILYWSEKA